MEYLQRSAVMELLRQKPLHWDHWKTVEALKEFSTCITDVVLLACSRHIHVGNGGSDGGCLS